VTTEDVNCALLSTDEGDISTNCALAAMDVRDAKVNNLLTSST